MAKKKLKQSLEEMNKQLITAGAQTKAQLSQAAAQTKAALNITITPSNPSFKNTTPGVIPQVSGAPQADIANLPPSQPVPEPPGIPPIENPSGYVPEFILNEKGGIIGLKTPDGKTIMGSSENMKKMAAVWQQQLTLPAGSTSNIQTEKKQDIEAQKQQAISQIGQQPSGVQMAQQPTTLDWKQVALSTAAKPGTYSTILGSAGAGVGAAAGIGIALGTPLGPVGMAIGAGVGAALGLGISIMSNIKQQKTQGITAQKLVLTAGSSNLNSLIALAAVDPANVDYYIGLYNEQQARISEAYSQLKLDTESNLNLALSEDGTTTLIRYENYFAPGGDKDYYDAKMAQALKTQDPNAAIQTLMMGRDTIMGEME